MKNTGVIMLGRTIMFFVWGGPGSTKSNPCAPIGVGIQGSAQPGHRLEGRTSPSPPWTSPSGVRHDRGGGTSWVILPPGITPSRRNGPICVSMSDMSLCLVPEGVYCSGHPSPTPTGPFRGGEVSRDSGAGSVVLPLPPRLRGGVGLCVCPLPLPFRGGGVWGVTEGHSSLGRWQ